LADIEDAGLVVNDFSTTDSDLEDIFIRLTHGGQASDHADDAA